MKGFIVSICIIAVISGLVITNSFFTLNLTEKLVQKIDLLTSDNYIIMKEIQEQWYKSRFFLGLSSSTKETDKIDDMLASLEAMYKSNDFSGLEEKKSLLINYIKLINSHERVNLENIL